MSSVPFLILQKNYRWYSLYESKEVVNLAGHLMLTKDTENFEKHNWFYVEFVLIKYESFCLMTSHAL